MKASAVEFRLRYLVHAAIYVIGFTAPWNYFLKAGASQAGAGGADFASGFWSGRSVWLPAALQIERAGWMSLTGAANFLLGLGIAFVLAGAVLRTWGSAYLGAGVVQDGRMHGGAVVADGPYRHLRNPLYLGTFLHTFALALLMPASGAVFAIIAIGFEELRLIGGEEAFLEGKLGEAYLAYKAKVPRLLPAFKARVAASGVRPAWGKAFLAETYMWGVVVAFASVGTRYNALLVTQGVLVAFGVSLVARAFVPRVSAD
jgi:protein-S-isoprenylcysteine O-methyltransferase Ste14